MYLKLIVNCVKSLHVYSKLNFHYIHFQIFAHYELLDHYGKRVSEGQKASFCLEDNDCNDGVSAVYDCENYGDQGITPGCKVRTYDFLIVDPRYINSKKNSCMAFTKH